MVKLFLTFQLNASLFMLFLTFQPSVVISTPLRVPSGCAETPPNSSLPVPWCEHQCLLPWCYSHTCSATANLPIISFSQASQFSFSISLISSVCLASYVARCSSIVDTMRCLHNRHKGQPPMTCIFSSVRSSGVGRCFSIGVHQGFVTSAPV